MPFIEWMREKGFLVRQAYDIAEDEWVPAARLELFPFQERILGHCLTPNDDGSLPYTTVVYSTIKKSGKTTLAAAVGAWFGDEVIPGSEVYCIANDLEQAEGRVFRDLKYHADQNDLHTTKYKIDYDNDTFIQALSHQYSSAAGSRHALTLWDELWGFCQTSYTEAYTKDGWKKWDELQEGDLIATLNINDESFEWQRVSSVSSYLYDSNLCGPLVKLDHRRIECSMTQNHTVVGMFRKSGNDYFGRYELREARDVAKSYEMIQPVAREWKGIPTGLSSDWLYLLGMFIAEGSYVPYTTENHPHQRGTISIAQFPGEKSGKGDIRQKIKDALDGADIEYREDGRCFYPKGEFGYYVRKHLDTGSFVKSVPEFIRNATPQELSIFFGGVMDGDGWVAGKGYQIELVSEVLADHLIEIGTKLGYYVKYMPHKGSNIRLSFSLGNIRIDKRNWKEEDYLGVVWCPTVNNGTWLARNSKTGHVFWTGNTSERSRRLWAELTPIPTVPNSLQFIATYAGYENESDLLWDLYANNVGDEEYKDGLGEKIPGLEDLPCWGRGKTFVYWDHEPRLPWQTEDYYQTQRQTLRASDYLRLHMNRWVSSQEAFIPIEWYDLAAKAYVGPATMWEEHPYRKYPIFIGVDAGVVRDSTAIVAVAYDGTTGRVGQVFDRIWTPSGEDDPIDLQMVENFIIEMYNKFNVAAIYYDPTHLYQMMRRLEGAGLPVHEYKQSSDNMTRASQMLYDLLRLKNFDAYPAPELRSHLQMSVATVTSRGFRIVKDKRTHRHHKIDGAIALAMACYAAVDSGGVNVSEVMRIESPFSDMTGWKESREEDKILPFALRSD